MSSTINVGLIQTACSPDPKANLAKTLAATERAAKPGAKIICTQELFRSQYFCQSEDHEHFKLAEPIPGSSTQAFQKLAKKYRAVIVASLFEKRAAGVYHNTAAIIDADGSLLGIYRKMHIPDEVHCLVREVLFHAGRSWLSRVADENTPKDRRAGLLGPTWYPEGARLTALQGAEILFYQRRPSGWHPGEKRNTALLATPMPWETIQRSHAIANGCLCLRAEPRWGTRF